MNRKFVPNIIISLRSARADVTVTSLETTLSRTTTCG